MTLRSYSKVDTLKGIMFEFGRFFFTYEPPSDCVESEIQISISSDATMDQMAVMFYTFLDACGFDMKGKEVIIGPIEEEGKE